ncbi:unnamed protein product [Paramecium pentaurelia]|uniref:Uncharacterized protein n=1 Tax=Paramecium pentaurelia TaxID=43138 RepID=A0A8S1SJY2_9CILI|nr:unnamed protein product [Paramecium pentaurelia]
MEFKEQVQQMRNNAILKFKIDHIMEKQNNTQIKEMLKLLLICRMIIIYQAKFLNEKLNAYAQIIKKRLLLKGKNLKRTQNYLIDREFLEAETDKESIK